MKDLFNLYEELIDSIEEMINTTMSVMAPYPVDVVGRPNPFPNKKEKKGKEKSAMYKFSYKKNGKIRKSPMTEVVEGNYGKDKRMDIFESLENLNVSEECFDEIQNMVEEYLNEYINQKKMQQLSDVYIKRKNNVKDAPEGPEKEEAKKKLNRNIELSDNKIERSGSALQKAVHRGYSKNAGEKKALLKAGYTIKEDPIVKGQHNITKY